MCHSPDTWVKIGERERERKGKLGTELQGRKTGRTVVPNDTKTQTAAKRDENQRGEAHERHPRTEQTNEA